MKRKKQKIARINDQVRRKIFEGGGLNARIMLTHSIASLPEESIEEVLKRVASFSDFDTDNDPWSERDMGSFQFGDDCIVWKIDYLQLDTQYAAEDPSDFGNTQRVLTVMRRDEY